MFIYLFRSGPAEDDPSRPEYGPIMGDASMASLREVLPGVKRFVALPDFILSGQMYRDMQTTEEVAAFFKCTYFVMNHKEFNPGSPAPPAVKQINNLTGKEKVFVVAHADMWPGLAAALAGEGALPADFSPAHFSLAEFHTKGFPGRDKAVLNWTKTREQLLGA